MNKLRDIFCNSSGKKNFTSFRFRCRLSVSVTNYFLFQQQPKHYQCLALKKGSLVTRSIKCCTIIIQNWENRVSNWFLLLKESWNLPAKSAQICQIEKGNKMFCRDPFWNNSIWNTTTPALTQCFEETVLLGIPCMFLWVATPFWIHFLRQAGRQQTQYPPPKRKLLTLAFKLLSLM